MELEAFIAQLLEELGSLADQHRKHEKEADQPPFSRLNLQEILSQKNDGGTFNPSCNFDFVCSYLIKQGLNKGGIKMKCNQCQTEMTKDCNVRVEMDTPGIVVSKKKGKGLFNKVSAKTKAAVCSNCGYVALYLDEYKEFSE